MPIPMRWRTKNREAVTSRAMPIAWPVPEGATGVCLITMARAETLMLTHWISHYTRALDNPKFILIDDASHPDMVGTLRATFPDADLDVIRLPAAPFSTPYKSAALSALAAFAVGRFEAVIATDADEIVVPVGAARERPFIETLRAAPAPFAAPVGLMPIHGRDEAPFDPMRPVGAQRAAGLLNVPSTKPALWKGRAGVFAPGQHELVDAAVPVVGDLALVHLKWVDRDALLERQTVRLERDFASAHGTGAHWRRPLAHLKGLARFKAPPQPDSAPPLLAAIEPFLRKTMTVSGERFILRGGEATQLVRFDGAI